MGQNHGLEALVVALTDACVPELRTKLEFYTGESSFRFVKDEVVSDIERLRDASSRPVPMDTWNQKEQDEGTFCAPELRFWGGATDPHEIGDWNWTNNDGTWGWEDLGAGADGGREVTAGPTSCADERHRVCVRFLSA